MVPDLQDEIRAGGTEDVYLEQLYISNKSAFDRNATTRRSKVREQMRQQTGKSSVVTGFTYHELTEVVQQAGATNSWKDGRSCSRET